MFSPRSSSKPKPQCEMLCERKKKKTPRVRGSGEGTDAPWGQNIHKVEEKNNESHGSLGGR